MISKPFRSQLSETIFNNKYKHQDAETWERLAETLVNDVWDDCYFTKVEKDLCKKYITEMKFIPGGRYLYYAGRPNKFFNNCYLLKAEHDTREDWAELSWKSERALTTGGGIGVDYSVYRPNGALVKRTGGVASGPISKMKMINEIGRYVMQGGARRSAIYASLNWQHEDIKDFLYVKDWYNQPVKGTNYTVGQLKELDFNYKADLDMTNISVNFDTSWLKNYYATGNPGDVFYKTAEQAIRTGEPGFSFNFFDKETETLRNACCEVTSSDDSDVCNLGSLNLSRIDDIAELSTIVDVATKFLLLGTLKADLPYDKVKQVREKNRRLGLGLMGVHEWLIKRGLRYEVNDELRKWLSIYKGVSTDVSLSSAKKLGVSIPVANRAIAPTGTIGMMAGTTTGIEPVYATAYKRRYLVGGSQWRYQYEVDFIANQLIKDYGVDPDSIETSIDLAKDFERRIKFQADVQDYVDMAISSTINLPAYTGTNADLDPKKFGDTLAKYADRLRGFTCYPDGARGGQPLVSVPYLEAKEKLGKEFDEHIEENDVCSITGGGYCGM